MRAAMTIGKTARLLPPRLFFAPDGGLVPDVRETSHPFTFVRGESGSQQNEYLSAYMNMSEEPQELHRVEVKVAVPQVEEVEQKEAEQLPRAKESQNLQAIRAGYVQILGPNDQRIVTCKVRTNGSAEISEQKDTQSKDVPLGNLPAGSLPANRWHTVVIQHMQEGCNISIGEDKTCTGNGTIEWPSKVHLRLGSDAWTVAPMAWFTKPSAS